MPGVEITGNVVPRSEEILTQQALDLIALLHRNLNPRRLELLAARKVRMQQIADGKDFDFLPQTKAIRDDKSWKVAPAAPGLNDRRVEITGPTERKMTINALNSGAKVWLADLEDSNTPLWENVIMVNSIYLMQLLAQLISLMRLARDMNFAPIMNWQLLLFAPVAFTCRKNTFLLMVK
jgi:malate synthase A